MTPWYVRKAQQPDAPLRLICLPYAGGSAVSADQLAAWKRVTQGPFTARMFEGDHFFIHSAASLVLQQIESDLSAMQ
jgi:medium-chain acyl-[acyl-carrier-protein] hydrolase